MSIINALASRAGIDLNNEVIINSPDVIPRIIGSGTLGLGETYMEGLWEASDLSSIFFKIGIARITARDLPWRARWYLIWGWILNLFRNPQSILRSKKVAIQHYDLGNDFYSKFLDKKMIYSCGYWANANSLDEAQMAKAKLIGDKLHLHPGMKVLDIGCGWGGLTSYIAEKYGVEIVGITISREQYEYCCLYHGGKGVEYRLVDYRDLIKENQIFDAIYSVGMFEHVGPLNYLNFFKIINKILKSDGLFLLHTIAGNRSLEVGEPWITKYIFPNSALPSIAQISNASEGILMIEDLHNFGTHYDRTLIEWYQRFNETYDGTFGDRNGTFFRMWKYYLLMSAGMFRARQLQLYQIVFSKGKLGGYKSVR